MNRFRELARMGASVFLSAVLVLGQLLLVLHELDSGVHAAGESCEICLVGAALDHGTAAGAPPLTLGVTHDIRDAPFKGLFPSVTRRAFAARAPPPFLRS